MSDYHIIEPENKKHILGERVAWPAWELPSYRKSKALENGAINDFLFIIWGGIGDQICSEPTIRYALEQFKDCTISVATDYPELFKHLPVKDIFDTKIMRPDQEKYFVFKTITAPSDLSWQFMSHCITHCVDFASLNALRCQLPIANRAVQLEPSEPKDLRINRIIEDKQKYVIVHAGKHWESKTFPVEYWNEVLVAIINRGFIPVLIGKTVDHHVGYVDCNHPDAIDLRDQCSLNDTMWLCKNAQFVVCSDSSPLHMAVTGNAHIAFICTAKHQDYIYHWRKNEEGVVEWAWRMKHFNVGGIWDIMSMNPNTEKEQVVDKCSQEDLMSWLPDPREMALWLSQKL